MFAVQHSHVKSAECVWSTLQARGSGGCAGAAWPVKRRRLAPMLLRTTPRLISVPSIIMESSVLDRSIRSPLPVQQRASLMHESDDRLSRPAATEQTPGLSSHTPLSSVGLAGSGYIFLQRSETLPLDSGWGSFLRLGVLSGNTRLPWVARADRCAIYNCQSTQETSMQ